MASFSTILDNFDDGVTNSSLWNATVDSPATIAETGGRLTISWPNSPSAADTGGHYTTQTTYDLTNTSVHVEVPPPTDLNHIGVFFFVGDGSVGLNIYLFQNHLYFEIDEGLNSYTYSTNYNMTNHRWWRIRHASGTVYLETSPAGAGGTWTVGLSHSISLSVTALISEIFAKMLGAPPPSTSAAYFDNFNTAKTVYNAVSSASDGGHGSVSYFKETYSITETASGGGTATHNTVYQSLPQKDYEYRVFDHAGNYIATWQNVTSGFTYSQSINQNASELNVKIARAPDNLTYSFSTLKDDTGATISDASGDPILVQTQTANSVGPDTDVDVNYNVDVYAFYGGYDGLLDASGNPILDNNSDPILVQFGAPNGKRVYSGYIADYSLSFGSNTGVDVTVVPHATEMSHHVFKTVGGATTVEYNSKDPVLMARDAMDRYITEGGIVTYDTTTIPLSGQVSSYDFKLQTTREAIDKTVDLLPTGYYQFVDPGERVQYLLLKSNTPDHLFYYEKHITELDLSQSITQLINKVYFVGGDTGSGTLFKYYEDPTSISAYRSGLDRQSDSRVTLSSSADILSQSKIASYKAPRWKTSVTITDAVYDIESIKLGQMVGFRNFGTFADSLVLQIVTLTRYPHKVTLDLDMVVDSDSKRLQDMYKRLQNQEIVGIPDIPA